MSLCKPLQEPRDHSTAAYAVVPVKNGAPPPDSNGKRRVPAAECVENEKGEQHHQGGVLGCRLVAFAFFNTAKASHNSAPPQTDSCNSRHSIGNTIPKRRKRVRTAAVFSARIVQDAVSVAGGHSKLRAHGRAPCISGKREQRAHARCDTRSGARARGVGRRAGARCGVTRTHTPRRPQHHVNEERLARAYQNNTPPGVSGTPSDLPKGAYVMFALVARR